MIGTERRKRSPLDRRKSATMLASALLTVSVWVGAATPVAAHPLAPALLDVREVEAGSIVVTWKTPTLQPRDAAVFPSLPADCTATGAPTIQSAGGAVQSVTPYACDRESLVGAVFGVDGLERSRTNALLRVELADGRVLNELLDADFATFEVPTGQTAGAVAMRYFMLGLDHIAGGFDHLLFVLALMLLTRDSRALLRAVTAFTVGHSITLAAAALGYVSFPSSLAELLIALSIVWLATELLHAEPTAIRRWPGLIAACFGLLHGLGFAGALSEIGLPGAEIPAALLAFNVGIEVGQLLFVACALGVLRVATVVSPRLRVGPLAEATGEERRLRSAADHGIAPLAPPVPIAGYAIGTLAAAWSLERALALL